MKTSRHQSGFALIITLSLLSLLVLAVLALSALVRINGQVAATGVYQVQARQNALLGLSVGLSDLQRHAGDGTRITGMAGITGIAPGAANTTRHWCGVWRSDGTFVAWLASGAQASATAALQNGTAGIELVAGGSAGALAANSEHVIAGRIPLVVPEVPGAPGTGTIVGNYAYLVSDEGVKTPAYAPGPVPVVAPVVFATSATSAQGRLRDALAAYPASLPKVLVYEQLALLPAPAAALTPSVLQDNFHHVTLGSRFVSGAQLQAGLINVNTNSATVWRNILQTYNNAPGAPAQIAGATLSARGTTIQNSIATYTAAQKPAGGPFRSVAEVAGFLAVIFPAGSPSASQIMAVIAPMLAVRSDTFRIRGYGEAMNPADATKIEASAQCEAIVQRTLDPAPNGLGNKFSVVSFRWLGPGDL